MKIEDVVKKNVNSFHFDACKCGTFYALPKQLPELSGQENDAHVQQHLEHCSISSARASYLIYVRYFHRSLLLTGFSASHTARNVSYVSIYSFILYVYTFATLLWYNIQNITSCNNNSDNNKKANKFRKKITAEEKRMRPMGKRKKKRKIMCDASK